MLRLLSLLPFFFLFCTAPIAPTRHVFYLHGRIVELQGANAEHPQFGKYLYHAIIDSLQSQHTVVHHDIRPADVDFYAYAEQLSQQINRLIQREVAPEHITVIGASKGAVLAMYVAHLNLQPINYVLLGANNDNLEQQNDWHLHGRILGIYEQSDRLAGKHYQYWQARSPEAVQFAELKINTGLGHGFLYQPLEEWLSPTRKWMNTTAETAN